LNASGSSTGTIYFTSYKDDSAGGDTNGDATSTTASNSDWDTIQVDAGASTTLSYAVARYAGYNGCCGRIGAQIYNHGGVLNLAHSETSATWYNIYQDSGTSTISSTNIHDAYYYGFYFGGAQQR
jgi:large repetitive protein